MPDVEYFTEYLNHFKIDICISILLERDFLCIKVIGIFLHSEPFQIIHRLKNMGNVFAKKVIMC